MRAMLLFVLAALGLAGGAAYAMQTGDAYLDAQSAIVASPKPAEEVFRIIDEGHVDVNQYYSDGNTLMHMAAIAGRADVMEGLLARGGRLDIKRNQSDAATPVELAKRPEIVAYLTKIGAMKKLQPGSYKAAASPTGETVKKPAAAAASAQESPRRKMCNERHYSSSSLCSDSTCKMREYRKWQTCLQTGSYY